MAAAGPGAVIEGVQRPGLQDDAPGGLDQRPAGGGASAFADAAAARRRVPGLADLGVQAEIGGEEPDDVADARDEARGADQV